LCIPINRSLAIGPQDDASDADVHALLVKLISEDDLEQLDAVIELGSIGPYGAPAAHEIARLMEKDSRELQYECIVTLGKIHSHPEIALPALGGLLRHESPWVRITAVRAISEFGPAANSFSTVMLELLSDKKIMLRSAAADALGRIGNGDVGVIDALVRALADADGVVTVSAANVLLHIGSPAVPAMIRKLPEEPFRNLIVDVLGEMGPEAESAVPALVELLKTVDENLKREIFIALATIGPKASAGTASMMQILENPDAGDDSAGAAYVLAPIGEKKTIPVLKGILETSQSPQVLRSAAWAILQLDPENPKNAAVVMPHLFPAMSSEIPLVRKEAISAMSTLGQAARSAWPDIMEHAESDPDASVRAESLRAVAEIQAPVSETLPVALASLKDPDVTVRNSARYLLGRIGKEGQIAAPVLREALRRGDPLERIVSAWALVNVDSTPENIQAAIPMLLAGLRHPNPEVRTEVAITLGTTGTQSKDVLAELKFAANDSDPLVRQAAKEALTKLSHGN